MNTGGAPRQVGYSLAGFGFATIVGQVWLLRAMDRTFGAARAAEIGSALPRRSGTSGFAFGHGNALIIVCIVLTTMGFVAGPALVACCRYAYRATRKGCCRAVIASMNGVAAVLTPLSCRAVQRVLGRVAARRLSGRALPAVGLLGVGGMLMVARRRARRARRR
jgi:hypothetical protein